MTEASDFENPNNQSSTFVIWGHPEELALCEAVQSNNLKLISKCIGNRVDINFVDGFGKTPLHYACSNGNLEVVKLLVANKALVDVHDTNYTTPLHLAAKGNHDKVVKFLIMSKATIDYKCLSGCVPIDFAPFNSETWKTLLKASKGDLPSVDHLMQTRTVPLVPQFAIKREIDKLSAKSEAKGNKKANKSGKKKKK